MIARSIKRDIAYLRIRVGTFQNWVSSLWADLEVIFRRLTEKKAAQGLQHEEEELFNNIRLWYMFPLEEALEGRYEPTDKDMRVLSSRLSFQKVTVLLRIACPLSDSIMNISNIFFRSHVDDCRLGSCIV